MKLTVKPIESRKIWENFVLREAPQALFQSWLWGQVQEKMGLAIWRLGFYQNQKLIGIAQASFVHARRGKYLHIRHGPIINTFDSQAWQAAVTEIKNLAQKGKAWFVRMSPLIAFSDSQAQLFVQLGFREAPILGLDAQRCWVLDLGKKADELLAGMRKTTRYEIRRAEKLGVCVIKSTKVVHLKQFLNLYEETARRQHFVGHSGIVEEFTIFAKENRALLFLGEHNGELLAAALVIFYGGQAIYHHGASKVSQAPVSYLVQWEAIREAQKRGLKVYNFWGISPEDAINHPWRGLSLFKRGFGGREIEYLPAYDLPLNRAYYLTYLFETCQRLLRDS